MSTRSQVVIKDSHEELWFYRHSSGYPSGNLPQLYKFMKWLHDGKIRDNASQSSGWLIILGAVEYGLKTEPTDDSVSGWKVGAYEPCQPSLYGDTEWLYIIDVEKNTITIDDIYGEKLITLTFDELEKYKDDWDKVVDIAKEGDM